MAITNAQQYQQLVNKPADGKRPGYRGDAAYRSFSAQSTGSQRGSATKSEVGGGRSRDNEPSLRDDPDVKQVYKDSKDDEIFQKRRELKKEVQRQEEEKAEEKVERFRNKQFTGLPFPGVTSLLNPLFKKGMTVNRNFFLDKVLGAGRLGDLTPEEFANLSLSEQEAAYKDYMSNRLAGKTDAYGNPTRGFSYDSEGNLVGNFIDDGGPNPIPFIPPIDDDTEEDTTTPVRNLGGATARIGGSLFNFDEFAADGGRIGAMDGGIMNVEDLDREAFLLGGIAKGLKKAVRGVKKIAKSPLGKAALIGAGFGLAGMGPFKGLAGTSFGKGLAGLRGTLFGQAGSRVGEAFVPYKEGLLTKLGLTKGGGSLIPTFKGGITLASILPLLAGKTDEEKDDILKDYYAQKLEPGTTARQAGSEFDFYNYNLAEGGTPRKEPVAKKVMPLLDMGGMEKDYRAEGGFVPIGRMEKADDVPARLSKNEFVFTADAVRNAGDGDVDKGAEVMYNMMKNLEAGGDVSEESQGLEGAREMFQTSQRLGEVI